MPDLLQLWDASLTREQHARLQASLTRRQFMIDTAKAGALALSPCLLLTGCDDNNAQAQTRLTQIEPWYTFATAQQVLFPDDGNGPDAKSLNATAYLKFVLDAPDTDADDRKFILDGVDWLNRLAIARYTSVFTGCAPEQRERILHEITRSEAGERWLAFMLVYLLEALLVDPIYGGNPDGIGWKWLQHIPGFPRPPLNKRYIDLL
jgi:gluconate 2-dehydrogenase gamma chain